MRDLMRRAWWVTRAATVLLCPAALLAAGANAPAAWADPCTGTTTITCTYTGAGTKTFTVPAGVSSLDVTAVAARGGAGCPDFASGAGGLGASVEDTAVSASGGQRLSVVVGDVGDDGTLTTGGAGGSPGGGG